MRVLFNKRSFTILELVIVLVIVGILAAVSVPAFTTIKEKTLVNEAIANLKLIAAAEKVYGTEIQGYFTDGNNNATVINNRLKLSLSDRNWEYDITGDPAAYFDATASRRTGPWNNCVYRIDETMSEPVPEVAGNCP